MGPRSKFSPKVKARAVGLVAKSLDRYDSEWAAIQAVAVKIGCAPQTLRRWVRQADAEEDKRLGVTPAERERRKKFEAAFVRMCEPLETVDPEQLPRQPKTVMERIGKRLADDLGSWTEGRTDEQVLHGLASVYPEFTSAELAILPEKVAKRVAAQRRMVARDRAGAQLLKLMDDAHRSVPNAWLLVIPDPVVDGHASLEALGKAEALFGTRGEERASLLADSVAYTAEAVYRPYLERVWKLSMLRRQALPGKPPAFGSLVNELSTAMREYPLLVEPDAAHVRNAIAHRPHGFEYLPRKRAVKLRDSKRREWTKTLKLSELERMSSKMFRLAGILFPKAVNAFMEDAYFRVEFPLFLDLLKAARNNDPDGVERAAAALQAAKDGLIHDIAQLAGASARDGRS